ncbi:MAG: hypothetical protein ACYTDW_21635 [Planctomycetota bacterium]|jgi:hypothetical protein
MKFHSERIILFVLVNCITFSGCSDKEEGRRSEWSTEPPPPKSVVATNKIRIEHGLRQVKENWSFNYHEFGAENWKDSQGRPCKRVYYDRNYKRILYETDKYFSGAAFPSRDPDGGTSYENLQITYYYAAKRFVISVTTNNKKIESMFNQLKDRIKYPTRDGGYLSTGQMGQTNDETLEIADEILKTWGLERL